jgi:hypothetical protein
MYHIATKIIDKVSTKQFMTFLLGVFASLLITVASFTGTASAAASDCSSSGPIVCFWIDNNFTNLRVDYYSPGYNACHGFSSTFNDKISSLAVHSSLNMIVYQNANCSGIAKQFYAGDEIPSLSWVMNDSISSFKMTF